MALLKSLIQRLLDSRTTPEEAGHSALPDWAATPITYTGNNVDVAWGSVFAQVMPSDGYVVATAIGTESNSYMASHYVQCDAAWAVDTIKISFPVAKGQWANIGARYVKDVTIEFFPLIAAR